MANSFYKHSGYPPGSRARNSSQKLRAEFSAIEAGAQAIEAALALKADAADLSEVDNTSDADKPISTLTQAALDLKADYTSFSGGSGYRYVNGSLIQFGYLTTHATANTEKQHSFPIAFASTPIVVGVANSAYIPPDLRIYSPATGYFHTMSSGSGVGFLYIAIA